METYDKIGTGYNDTRRADPYLLSRMVALLAPMPGERFLDVGCGTGNYTRALAERGLDFTGIDPSALMLQKARNLNSSIKWLEGKAEAMPLENGGMDGVLASLTLHHWEHLKAGFREVYRVLKPGGRLVIFSSTPEQMKGYWLWHYFPQMMADSCEQMPGRAEISSALQNGGLILESWEAYAVREDLQDHFLYVGKNRPELYLDERIRAGISSFAALAYQKEVETGLAALATDIASGQISRIIDQYAHSRGDYAFLRASRPQD